MNDGAKKRVEIEENVVFGQGGGRNLVCDIYHPPQPGSERPAVLLIHGGAWMQGDKSQLKGYGVLIGREGYLCVCCEYRLSGEAKWPAQIHDVKAALRWMRANSERLGIDPDRIAVSGNSAGGHLALILAGSPNHPELEGEGGNSGISTVCKACIAFYAPTLLRSDHFSRWRLGPSLFPDNVTEKMAKQASPVEHARRDFPPTLLIHGDRDETVPPSATLAMYKALSEAGAPVELHMFNNEPHAFDAGREMGRLSAHIMKLFLDKHI